ncbi:MAG TPA: hypothetical protein VLM91_26330 [Candidatus Methylomirabilis sp.]|nr:hypothetical protein [Candidatus Methylomirabilis sp.]
MPPIRPRLALLVIAVMLISAGLIYGAYWRGIERGKSDWRFIASRHGTNLPLYRDTSSALLRELITRESSLRGEGLTDWEIVNRLREWAHANILVSTPSNLLDQDKSFEFYNRNAGEIFAAFFRDRGGVWCGGAAYALMEVYGLFGFQASMIDYGKPGVMTHVVTLVKIKYDGMEKMVIQDPTLNVTYATRDDAPYDYFQLLTVLMRHQHERIRILPGIHGTGNVLVAPGDERFAVDYAVEAGSQPIQMLQNGVRKYRSKLSFESFERRFGEGIRVFLRKERHPGKTLYLLLYPLAGSDPSVVERAQQLTHGK